MKKKFSKLALAVLALPLFSGIASAETRVIRYHGHAVTVEVTLVDPDCGDQGVIIISTDGSDIGKVILLPK